jgi:endoglucanase
MAKFAVTLQVREIGSMSLLFGHTAGRALRILFFCLGAGPVLALSALHAQATPIEVRRLSTSRSGSLGRADEASGAGIAWPPYKNTPRPRSAAELEALHRAGFDTVRLPVDPAPFMVFQGTRREAVYEMLFDAIERIERAGLKTIVDLHPNSRHPVWGQNAVVAGLESPTFVAFSNAVGDMARQLSIFDAEDVALELINEPRPQPLGDNNLIYTFHHYEPFTFTHQGAKFIPWPDKYLDGVPWPASARPIDEPMALLDENMERVADLDFVSRQMAAAGARNNLKKFYASEAGPELIEERFATIAGWTQQHGIPVSRIFLGEFGVLRREPNTPGARCEDRMRWLADVRRTAEHHGFSWSYFNYDGPVAIVVDDSKRQLDPAVPASLGLTEPAAADDCQGQTR